MDIARIGRTSGDDGLPIISFAVVHGDTIHLCGVTAEPGGDVAEQTREVLARIDRLLGKAGSDRSRIVAATVYLADMGLFEAHNAAWNRWVDAEQAPARTCVEARLWRPGLLVEITVVALRA